MADRRYLHPLDRRQVKALYHLKRLTKRPMTHHLREAGEQSSTQAGKLCSCGRPSW